MPSILPIRFLPSWFLIISWIIPLFIIFIIYDWPEPKQMRLMQCTSINHYCEARFLSSYKQRKTIPHPLFFTRLFCFSSLHIILLWTVSLQNVRHHASPQLSIICSAMHYFASCCTPSGLFYYPFAKAL